MESITYSESTTTISSRKKTALILAFLLSFITVFAGTIFWAASYSGASDKAFAFGFQRAAILSAVIFIFCVVAGFLKFNIIVDENGITKTTVIFGYSIHNWDIEWDDLVSIQKMGVHIRLEAKKQIQIITFENFASKNEMLGLLKEKSNAITKRAIGDLSVTTTSQIHPDAKSNQYSETPARIGILFDIDELGGGLYGYSAYKIFFAAIDTRHIPGCSLSDGDTRGDGNQYCIAVSTSNPATIKVIKKALTKSDAKGLLPPSARFIDESCLRHESLVPSAQINSAGDLINCNTNWVLEAWKISKEAESIS